MTAHYVRSSPPHISSGISVPKKIWGTALALLPAVLAGIFQNGWNPVRILLAALIASAVSEYLSQLLFQRKSTLYQGSFFYLALLFSMMLPPTLPFWAVFFGCFAAIFIGKELFGGLGSFPFQPVLLGYLVLELSFPDLMAKHAQVAIKQIFSIPAFGFIVDVQFIAAILSGILLLWQRLARYEPPLVFLATVVLLAPLLLEKPAFGIISGQVLLSAFFYQQILGLGPMTVQGRNVFAGGSAIFTVIFLRNLPYFMAFSCAVLLMNAMTPWIDEWVRPKLSRLTKDL